MSNIQTVEDAFELGVAIVATVFAYAAVASIWSADTTAESINVFAQSVTILLLVLVPTSEFGIFLAFALATIGASISISGRDPRLFAAVLLAGMGWATANIITNIIFGI